MVWETSRGKLTKREYFSTFGNTRDERAERLLKEQGSSIHNLGGGERFVPSQSGTVSGYKVRLSGGGSTCTCKDFENGNECKHIKAAQAAK